MSLLRYLVSTLLLFLALLVAVARSEGRTLIGQARHQLQALEAMNAQGGLVADATRSASSTHVPEPKRKAHRTEQHSLAPGPSVAPSAPGPASAIISPPQHPEQVVANLIAQLALTKPSPLPPQSVPHDPCAESSSPRVMLSVASEAENTVESGSSASVGVFPAVAVGADPGHLGLGAVRQQIRGGGGVNVDPPSGTCVVRAGLGASRLNAVGGAGSATTPVCYYLDAIGRVSQVSVIDVARGDGSDWIQPAGNYADVLFDPFQKLGAWGANTGLRSPLPLLPANYINSYLRYSRVFEVGHVIAASLGGSNRDPLNFFPQYMNANRGTGSTWYGMEAVARNLKDACLYLMNGVAGGPGVAAVAPLAMPGQCRVRLELSFDFHGVHDMPVGVHNNNYVPSGGQYNIVILAADFNLMFPVPPPVFGMPPGPRAPRVGMPQSPNLLWFMNNAACSPGVPSYCGAGNNWLNQ